MFFREYLVQGNHLTQHTQNSCHLLCKFFSFNATSHPYSLPLLLQTFQLTTIASSSFNGSISECLGLFGATVLPSNSCISSLFSCHSYRNCSLYFLKARFHLINLLVPQPCLNFNLFPLPDFFLDQKYRNPKVMQTRIYIYIYIYIYIVCKAVV